MKTFIRATALSLGLALVAAPVVSVYAAQESATQYVSSSATTASVKAALLNTSGIDSTDINVKTVNNAVQLNGYVNNAAQVELAGKVASGVQGVTKVQNNLQVRAPVSQ